MGARTQIGLVGLGPMGQALARTLVASGATVQGWNRSPGTVASLPGVLEASSVTDLARSSDVIVVCVRDHAAFRAAFDGVAAVGTVVNMSSASPDEARRTASWAAERGIRYLSVAIMVPTPSIGTDDALFLASGPRSELGAVLPQLASLGTFHHVGDDPGAASLLDVAMLDVFFAGMTAFLHAAAMMTADGRTATELVPWADSVLDVLRGVFAGLAQDVDAGEHPGDEDRLTMDLAAIDHIVATSDEAGLDGGFVRAIRDLAAAEVDAGAGDEGFSRVVDALRGAAEGRRPPIRSRTSRA